MGRQKEFQNLLRDAAGDKDEFKKIFIRNILQQQEKDFYYL